MCTEKVSNTKATFKETKQYYYYVQRKIFFHLINIDERIAY